MREPHYLKLNRKLTFPHHIIFFDCETEPCEAEEGRLHVLKLGYACYVRLRGDRITQRWFRFTKVEEFWDFVKRYLKNKTRLYLMAHNADFDFNVLQYRQFLRENRFTAEFWSVETGSWVVVCRREKCTLILLDTFNFFPMSGYQLAKDFGLEKPEIDFERASEDELDARCRMDVEIIKTAVLWLINFLRTEGLGSFAYTLAGISWNVFRHRFLRENSIFIHSDEVALQLERESYRGGRNECFFIGEVEGGVYKLDVNSMYPYVMYCNPFPVELVAVLEDLPVEKLFEYMKNFLVIARVKVRVEKPVVGVKLKKLVFPVGVFWATLCSPEIELVAKYGEVLECKTAVLYKKDYIFKSFVEYWYKLKVYAEREGNKSLRLVSKLILNSLYGKFGQKNKKLVRAEEFDWLPEGTHRVTAADTGESMWVYVFGGEAWVSGDVEEANDSFTAVASFVTAYARCYLTELILKAGEGCVYYCDTDSLFVNEEGFRRLQAYVGGNELGKLKVEGTCSKLVLRGCKDYQFGGSVKIKGVRKQARQVDGCTYVQVQFLRTRSLMRKHVHAGVVEVEVEKKLKRLYDKGVVTPSGWVVPLALSG